MTTSSASIPTTRTEASSALCSCLSIENEDHEVHCYIKSASDCLQLTSWLQHQQAPTPVHAIYVEIENGLATSQYQQALADFFKAVAICRHLTKCSISIHQSPRFSAALLATLVQQASHLRYLCLQDLDLDGSPFAVGEALQYHPNLHTVQLIRCHAGPVHVLVQALSKMKQLRQVLLDGCILRQQCEADALNALASLCHSPTLQSLHLEDIPEVGTSCQLVTIMEALHSTNTDDTKHNSYNNNHHLHSSFCHSQQPSNKTTHLKELSLQVVPHDALPFRVLNAMGNMIRHNTTLQRLQVSWMGGEILWPMVQALSDNTTLQEFSILPNLYSNPRSLSSNFLERTRRVLETNTTLKFLWYDDWEAIDRGIDLYLKANQCHRQRLLADEYAPHVEQRASHKEWMEALVGTHEHVHVSYYWLSHNPSLVSWCGN